MKILVCGGRDFSDRMKMHDILKEYLYLKPNITIIHGAAKGADSLAGAWAKANDIPVMEFPADWNKHGKRAGPIRNQQMLDEGKPNVVIAFKGGNGTADMIQRSKKNGFEVRQIL